MKNHAEAMIFHMATLCRRRHKVACIAEPNLIFGSRFLRRQSVCGMGSRMRQIKGRMLGSLVGLTSLFLVGCSQQEMEDLSRVSGYEPILAEDRSEEQHV